MKKKHKDSPNCYIIIRNDAWLTADGSWTYYGPELAGYTLDYNLAKQLAKQLEGTIKSLSYGEVMALSLLPFDFMQDGELYS